MDAKLVILSGESNRPLANAVCRYLDMDLTNVEVSRYSNDNLAVQIMSTVRESDVFVIQSLYPHPSTAFVELSLMLDAAKSSSAGRITAVIPHYSYARSDKKDRPHISIAAKLIGDMLVTAGANRFLTMTLHSEAVQGFFDVPVDHLLGSSVICEYLRERHELLENGVALFDLGQQRRSGDYADKLGIPKAVFDKKRLSDTEVEISSLLGDVKDKDVIIFDDEIARGTSVVAIANAIQDYSPRSVRVACVHGLFCGPACDIISSSPISEVITTDTVDIPPEKRIDKVTILSVAPLFARAISRIHDGRSVTALFEN